MSRTLAFAFQFLFRNAGAIAVRVTLPALTGWVVLYASLALYLVELQTYLGNPSDRSASLVLGLATGGLLVALFIHSVIAASVAALALGRKDTGWKYFHIARREWRLYAAWLRSLLAGAGFIGAVVLVQLGLNRLAGTTQIGAAAKVIVTIGLLLLVVRIGFLITPVAVDRGDGEIVRRAWRLSAGSFWRLAAIVVAVLVPGFVVEAVGELLVRVSGAFPPVMHATTFAEAAAMFRAILPQLLAAVTLGYLISVVLLTAAAVSVYRQVADRPRL